MKVLYLIARFFDVLGCCSRVVCCAEMNRTDNKTVNVLDPRQQKYGGMDTPAAGSVTDIKGFSLMRGQVLSLKLDKMSDSIGGQTVVDPRGFLTDLNSLKNPDQVPCRLVGYFCNFPFHSAVSVSVRQWVV